PSGSDTSTRYSGSTQATRGKPVHSRISPLQTVSTAVPTNTPVVRPTVTPTPIPGTQTSDLIVNGGFESGEPPWQEQSAGNYQLISQRTPHTGSFSADFCNTPSCNDQLWQTITVPAQVATATLTFWLSVAGQ